MAFAGFGAAASAPAFGAQAPAPAAQPGLFGSSFGQTAGGFGAAIAPAAASPPLFQTASAAPAATPSFFGAPASSSAFGHAGASTPSIGTPSLFGASGGGLFGSAQPTQPQAFGTSSPALGGFGSAFGVKTPQQQPQQPQQAIQLMRKDRHPVSYSTKIEDLDDNSRAVLHALEKRIQQHRDECRQLEGFTRLKGGKSQRSELQAEVEAYSKKVQGLLSLIKSDKKSLEILHHAVMKLVRQTESVSHVAQRTKLRHQVMRQTAPGATLPGDLGRPPQTPSPHLVDALAHFHQVAKQVSTALAELEQLYTHAAARGRGRVGDSAERLPQILENFQVFFNHVVAHYSHSHLALEAQKDAFLRARRARGMERDPFAEADKRLAAAEERSKREAQARRKEMGGQAVATPVAPLAQAPFTPTMGLGTLSPSPLTPTLGAFAPAATTSAFAPAASTSAFGQPQPAPLLLGSPAPTPTLGQPAPATPAFGGFPSFGNTSTPSWGSSSSKKKSGGRKK